jgi:hypothetical protein
MVITIEGVFLILSIMEKVNYILKVCINLLETLYMEYFKVSFILLKEKVKDFIFQGSIIVANLKIIKDKEKEN